MRVSGMAIRRVFAEAVARLDGKTTPLGWVNMRRDRLEEFARSILTHDDDVVVEATGNAAAVAEVLAPHVGPVVIANALTPPWTSGQTEGQISRPRTPKRAMYGHSGADLLRARMQPL